MEIDDDGGERKKGGWNRGGWGRRGVIGEVGLGGGWNGWEGGGGGRHVQRGVRKGGCWGQSKSWSGQMVCWGNPSNHKSVLQWP